MTLIKMVCAHCGSTDVRRDAYAEWDMAKQEWALCDTYSGGDYCADCDGDTTIEEDDISEESPT